MRISTNRGTIDGIRIVSVFLHGGEICLEGYYSPAPHTESKLDGALDFEDAQSLVRQLTEVLKSMPCPKCGRKESP